MTRLIVASETRTPLVCSHQVQSSPSVSSGTVTIKVTKASGAAKHELVILKTDTAPNALPKVAKKDEAGEVKAGRLPASLGHWRRERPTQPIST